GIVLQVEEARIKDALEMRSCRAPGCCSQRAHSFIVVIKNELSILRARHRVRRSIRDFTNLRTPIQSRRQDLASETQLRQSLGKGLATRTVFPEEVAVRR